MAVATYVPAGLLAIGWVLFERADGIFAMLRAHVATGGHAAMVAPGTGTAHRMVERLAESEIPAGMLEPGQAPKPGVVGVLKGPLHEGLIIPGDGGPNPNRPASLSSEMP